MPTIAVPSSFLSESILTPTSGAAADKDMIPISAAPARQALPIRIFLSQFAPLGRSAVPPPYLATTAPAFDTVICGSIMSLIDCMPGQCPGAVSAEVPAAACRRDEQNIAA